MLEFRVGSWGELCFGLTSMKFVLVKLRESSLASSQSIVWAIATLSLFSSAIASLADTMILVSSAYRTYSAVLELVSGRSLMYILKRRGPKMDP